MTFCELLATRPVLLDGGTGTLLQSRGLGPGEAPEEWNLTHADDLITIHRSYYDAGADVVVSNTFGANPLKLHGSISVEETVTAAIRNLRTARDQAGPGYVALDVGPTGRLLAPLGDLDFDAAVASFRRVIEAGVQAGAEVISIETMTDLYELKAAVLAAKEVCDLPILASAAFDANGRLLTGGDPAALVSLLEGLGVTALGVNCGAGPLQLETTARKLLELSSLPVLLKPNAGLPCTVNGCTHYDIDAAQFAAALAPLVTCGVRLVGGCCGTTPQHIALLKQAVDGLPLSPTSQKGLALISSGSRAVDVHTLDVDSITPIQIPDDPDDLLDEVFDRQDEEEPVLHLVFGPDSLTPVEAVETIQAVCQLPLWLEGEGDLEPALRRLNGKALVTASKATTPLLRRFGGVSINPDGTVETFKRS